MSFAECLKEKARDLGAALVGVCPSASLLANREAMDNILPEHRSVVCLAIPHSDTALCSNNVRVKQHDTVYTYQAVGSVSHGIARHLEATGWRAVAVPHYAPIDMSDDKLGMVGDIDWKAAAVECGLASWGQNGLAVTPQYGPRVRIGGVLTNAVLDYDRPLAWDPCGDCRLCMEKCPVEALIGEGVVDKKKCGDRIFAYGLRTFTRLLRDLAVAENEEQVKKLVYSHRVREVWQTFQTGNYYYCWVCQEVCPVGRNQSVKLP